MNPVQTDPRIPIVPNFKALQEILNLKKIPTNGYTEVKPNVFVGYSTELKGDTIEIASEDYFFLEKISFIAKQCIFIHHSSIVSAKEISFKAPIVQIYDDNKYFSVRTTLDARKTLSIEAEKLLVDGADIWPAPECTLNVKNYSLCNTTKNTNHFAGLCKRLSSKS